jgi:hypothetical protein
MVADYEAPRPPRRSSTFVPVHPVQDRSYSAVPDPKNTKTSLSIPRSVWVVPQILRQIQPHDGPIDEAASEGRQVALDC